MSEKKTYEVSRKEEEEEETEEEQKCAISSINSHCWEHSPQSVSSMSSAGLAQQEEKRHMVCLLCGFQSVERRDTKFDFSTYDEFEAKRYYYYR